MCEHDWLEFDKAKHCRAWGRLLVDGEMLIPERVGRGRRHTMPEYEDGRWCRKCGRLEAGEYKIDPPRKPHSDRSQWA